MGGADTRVVVGEVHDIKNELCGQAKAREQHTDEPGGLSGVIVVFWLFLKAVVELEDRGKEGLTTAHNVLNIYWLVPTECRTMYASAIQSEQTKNMLYVDKILTAVNHLEWYYLRVDGSGSTQDMLE